MNKKGLTALAIVIAGFWITFAGMSVSAIILRPQFIVRKAIEKCVNDPAIAKDYCQDKVAKMTKQERLEYIKDNAPADPNQQYKQNFHG